MNPEEIPLRELQLPELTGWWPLAPGWWVLIAIAVLGLLWLLYRAVRRFKANAPRRLALRQLDLIQQNFERGENAVLVGRSLSSLLRRAMLAYAPRSEVAGLSGEAWLRWLDYGLPQNLFCDGPGRIVESLPYMNPESVDDDTDVGGLLDAVRQRLQQPLASGY
jgi:hypothetical protein